MTTLGEIPREWFEDVIPLVAALACGAVIGWDRESKSRAAGLRTHMMVSLGAAAFTLTALGMTEDHDVDPARVIGAIVGGVGFLGAGSIMKLGGRIHGLTTAAGLWVVAGIGIACGLGFYHIAVAVAGLAFVTLTAIHRLESLAPTQPGVEPENVP